MICVIYKWDEVKEAAVYATDGGTGAAVYAEQLEQEKRWQQLLQQWQQWQQLLQLEGPSGSGGLSRNMVDWEPNGFDFSVEVEIL